MAEKVLTIPMFILEILGYLGKDDLLIVAQVNRIWAKLATDKLWEGRYPPDNKYILNKLEEIANMGSHQLLKYHTDKIKHLIIKSKKISRIPHVFPRHMLQFPNLRSLTVNIKYDFDGIEGAVAECLSFKLVALEFRTVSGYSPWLFQQIASRAPFLQVLILECDDPEGNSNPASLPFGFLGSMQHLRFLDLAGFMLNDIFNILILRDIITRPRLQALHIDSPPLTLTTNLLDDMQLHQQNMPPLRSLAISGSPMALAFFMSELNDLEYFKSNIVVLDQLSNEGLGLVLQALARFSNLRKFNIHYTSFPGNSYVPNLIFMSLAENCCLLQTFHLTSTNVSLIMTDRFIEKLARRLPSLQTFRLANFGDNHSRISHKSLVSFARYCPSLHTLRIALMATELCSIADEPEDVRFKNLQSLSLADITLHDVDHVAVFAEKKSSLLSVLDARFPRLKTLYFSCRNRSYNAFMLWACIDSHLCKRPFSTNTVFPNTKVCPDLLDPGNLSG